MAQPKLGHVFDRKIQIAPQHSRKRQTDKADFQSPWLVAVLSASRLTQHSPYISCNSLGPCCKCQDLVPSRYTQVRTSPLWSS